MYMVKGLLGISPDEGFHEGGLADPRRADNSNNGRRGLVTGGTVDEGDMEACLVALGSTTTLSVCIAAGPWSKGLQEDVSTSKYMCKGEGTDLVVEAVLLLLPLPLGRLFLFGLRARQGGPMSLVCLRIHRRSGRRRLLQPEMKDLEDLDLDPNSGASG